MKYQKKMKLIMKKMILMIQIDNKDKLKNKVRKSEKI